MQLTAVFESWHIGDGNYPPLHRGQLVRLSFELEASNLAIAPVAAGARFEHRGNAEYRGVGRVLRVYRGEASIAVIEANGFRFYVNGPVAENLAAGASVEFAGTLLLDHYLWVEFLSRYSDPPDLFYNLRVTRILRVSVPERFIARHSRGKALPTGFVARPSRMLRRSRQWRVSGSLKSSMLSTSILLGWIMRTSRVRSCERAAQPTVGTDGGRELRCQVHAGTLSRRCSSVSRWADKESASAVG